MYTDQLLVIKELRNANELLRETKEQLRKVLDQRDEAEAHLVAIATVTAEYGPMWIYDHASRLEKKLDLSADASARSVEIVRQLDLDAQRWAAIERHPPSVSAFPQQNFAPFGFCPICGEPGTIRERRPNGDDICKNKHRYPSRTAVTNKTQLSIKMKDWKEPTL